MDNEIGLSTCCRTCLRTTCDLTPLSGDDDDSVRFSFKLMSCISEIAWLQDNFPNAICDHCVEQLRISFNFRNTCHSANETLQKYIKQTQRRKIEPKDILYECIEGSAGPDSVNSLPVEDTTNSEYLHLKHFLDSDEELNKDDCLGSDNELSRSNSPGPDSGNLISNYSQSQAIEIEVQDIQEIIIDKPGGVKEENRLILSNGDEFNIQDIEIADENLQLQNTQQKYQKSNIERSSGQSNVVIKKEDNLRKCEAGIDAENCSIVTCYGNSQTEDILGSKQVLPSKLYSANVIPKATKNTGVQVKPPYAEDKKSTTSLNNTNVCTVCGNTYKKRANLKVHMRSHTGEKPFECKYCEKRFHHSSHLKEHVRRHTGEKPYPCTICTKRFTIKGELTMHIKSHTGEKPYACNICDRRCLTSTDLKVHMRTHTGEKPYSCQNCDKKFSSSYILSSHMKTHTGERPFSCKICDKNFTQSSHLNVHMKKHTGEKFGCKICPATFTHSSQLTVHKREHTGKQPYKCGVCGKICNYASELQSHMVKHTGQKFTCTICQKKFTTNAYLQEHIRFHTGENLFSCTICERPFTRQQYLKKHIRTHTGEKPFSCCVCDKTFTQSGSLKVHSRIHTGERPYPCDVCEKAFKTSSDLIAHSKKHKKYINL